VITVTIYQQDGEDRFLVHAGEKATDVTDQYEVRKLDVDTDHGRVRGYHIGQRQPEAERAGL